MTGGEAFEGVLDAARDGDPAAWTTLYDLVAPVVVAYLRAQSLPDPEDVAGETLLQVVRDIDRFNGSERQFVSWSLSIAHHRMLDARRAMGRRPSTPRPTDELPVPGTEDLAADGALASEAWREIQGHLGSLTDDQREVVLLRVVADLSLEDTARVLGRSVGSVKALQHRAFSALRARLSDGRNPRGLGVAHPA